MTRGIRLRGIVYRCYDLDGRLLYVGSTMCSVTNRLQQHRYVNRLHGKSAWINDMEHVAVDEYQTWQEALIAEAALILALNPEANKQRGSVESTRRCLDFSIKEDGLEWLLPEAVAS